MVKIITKLYLYDSSQEANNYRGVDYSEYISQGMSDIDDLTEILDVVDLRLTDLPFSEEFAPKTKFILELWEKSKDERLWKDFHLCVAKDIVSQPVLSDERRFDHTITFNEASVDAQGRLVDNCAVTYRLKDVSLESKPTYDTNAKAIIRDLPVNTTPPQNFGTTSPFLGGSRAMGHNFRWVFPNWYNVTINGVTNTPAHFGWNAFLLNQEIPGGQPTAVVTVPTPMLECLCSVSGGKSYRKNGYCSINVVVEELVITTRERNTILNMQVNPAANDANEAWTSDQMYSGLNFGWIESRPRPYKQIGGNMGLPSINVPGITHNFSQVAVTSPTRQNRTISFTVKPGCTYTITISRREFVTKPNNISVIGRSPGSIFSDWFDRQPAYYGFGSYQGYVLWTNTSTSGTSFINSGWPQMTMSFNAVLAGENKSLYLRNAPTENAYNLYNKALLTTQNYKKISGVPIDETQKAYYLNDSDKQELQNTIVVENFYNQKNWWELQLDIGKYIHAIPKVRFGSDDRFVTTWKRLGETKQFDDLGANLSIFNSRSVEECIASCSSYVTNMVQLGGIIDEWVAPASSSTDFLVYNDVAEIHTSKNIIELVDMEIKNISSPHAIIDTIKNIAGKGKQGEDPNGYVFSKDVYNTLSINANDSVNKGLAIYYSLGSNKFEGLNYRLPSINPGATDTEYAIKRIIGRVFGIVESNWQYLKVNDFLFHIVYRTKDTLRSNQTRPDLRKYLLTSKHDRVPQHNQYNNQTDTVVDSVKFGNNIYGKLIRTGNTNYTKTEWVDSLFKLKQAGELYTIRGNIYYVSKVKNTYYSNHIISEVEFSKDFNRLSQIIGIPSEPRFYEISEQSQIKREVSLDDYIIVGTSIKSLNEEDSYIKKSGWGYIRSLLLGNQEFYPKYAITVFKNDVEKETIAGNETFYKEVVHPVGAYSIQNTLTFVWKMEDNFSAGSQRIGTQLSAGENQIDTAYATLLPYRYTDVYGRSDMVDFAIISDFNMSDEQIKLRPVNTINLRNNEGVYLFGNEKLNEWGDNLHGIALLKDNRESLEFNYNLQVLTDSDRFVLSSYLWQTGKTNLKLALLTEEVNKISNDTVPERVIMENLYNFTYSEAVNTGGVKINIKQALQGVELTDVKAIAIISTDEAGSSINSGARHFVIARNVSELEDDDKNVDWYISNIDKNIFIRQ